VEKLKFEFPDTGEGVTEGQFLEWKVSEGDEIEEDQVVGEAETDKAVVEIPAPADGVVKSLKVSPGDTVKVGQVIMELETGDSETNSGTAGSEDSGENKTSEEDKSGNSGSGEESAEVSSGNNSEDILALPKVRKLAEEKNVDLASIRTGKRITEKEVREAAGEEEFEKSGDNVEASPGEESEESPDQSVNVSKDVDATPAVRKLAREEKVDISQVDGTGRGGKITKQDILDFKDSEQEGKEESDDGQEKVKQDGEVERVEINGVKRKTGEKMAESKFTAPHVTHMDKADVTELVDLRESVKEDIDEHLTYLPFIMKACYLAMQEHTNLNAELDEENDEIIRKNFYDFNIAVDTERGLMVPKVENIDSKNLVELARSISEVVDEAQSGKIPPEKMKGGTFSITNIGAIGGQGFTPIINYPQVAILGIGKIEETAEVIDGEVVPRNTVKLSLSYDHRVIDGAEAARFMNEVIENLEKPEEMLMEV
jgi:pyruvate dehydrogenase E2 component (dihydrolipoamide acetyltransferase)